jgi:high-affinity Fe2+/Pb2+ permease
MFALFLSLILFIFYWLVYLDFGSKKNDKTIEAIGWLGLSVSLLFCAFYQYLITMNTATTVFAIFTFIYFISSLIWLSYKYGDEPLWKSKD